MEFTKIHIHDYSWDTFWFYLLIFMFINTILMINSSTWSKYSLVGNNSHVIFHLAICVICHLCIYPYYVSHQHISCMTAGLFQCLKITPLCCLQFHYWSADVHSSWFICLKSQASYSLLKALLLFGKNKQTKVHLPQPKHTVIASKKNLGCPLVGSNSRHHHNSTGSNCSWFPVSANQSQKGTVQHL